MVYRGLRAQDLRVRSLDLEFTVEGLRVRAGFGISVWGFRVEG